MKYFIIIALLICLISDTAMFFGWKPKEWIYAIGIVLLTISITIIAITQ